MPLTPFQRDVARLIARNRVALGASYIAGGAALSELLGSPRVSRDIDVFSDTAEAVRAGWEADRSALVDAGMAVDVRRDRPSFIEAVAARGQDVAVLQWAQDSAFRFFPLVEHPDLGLALHPFDLATNKVLALVGRAEPRDWVDVIHVDRSLQPLGYLVWAAVGKDPGLGPGFVLNEAARTGRYTEDELAVVEFSGARPSAAELATRWRTMLRNAADVIARLPEQSVGRCVLTDDGDLMRADHAELPELLALGKVHFHSASLFGSYPQIA